MPAEDKKRLMHCALEFADNRIFLADDFRNQTGKSQISSVFVGLSKAGDVDSLVSKAKDMGATVTQEPQDMGDRFAMFSDPFGHAWQVGAPDDQEWRPLATSCAMSTRRSAYMSMFWASNCRSVGQSDRALRTGVNADLRRVRQSRSPRDFQARW